MSSRKWWCAAVDSATSLTANQRVTAELLNDSFFKMSPEASFLLRVSAVEALCPQADQTDGFKSIVDRLLTSIPRKASSSDREQIEQRLKSLAARQSVRSAYMSKIRQLIGIEKAKKFDALYERRSNFLHDGKGRGTLGNAADAALEIGLELLLTDIARGGRPEPLDQFSVPSVPLGKRILNWLPIAFW